MREENQWIHKKEAEFMKTFRRAYIEHKRYEKLLL